jgi:hypothetical protein
MKRTSCPPPALSAALPPGAVRAPSHAVGQTVSPLPTERQAWPVSESTSRIGAHLDPDEASF